MDKISVYPGIKALIFDCDGTLVDSMKLHMDAWKNTVMNMNAAWDFDLFFTAKGMKEKEIVDLYNNKYSTNINPEELVESKHDFFKKHIQDLKPIDPVVDIVYLYKDVLPMAVVSGGTKENVLAELKAVNLSEYFEIILTADDELKPKPAPDLFLHAAQLLNIQPEYCQVFEDADLGIEAAEAAGMKTLDIRIFLE